MDEKEQRKQGLELELEWVKYRLKTLDTIEEKLLQMRLLAEQVKQGNFTEKEMKIQNKNFNDLEAQVRKLDEESRRIIRWEADGDLK